MLSLTVPCPTCKAKVGEYCHPRAKSTGKRRTRRFMRCKCCREARRRCTHLYPLPTYIHTARFNRCRAKSKENQKPQSSALEECLKKHLLMEVELVCMRKPSWWIGATEKEKTDAYCKITQLLGKHHA